METVLVPEGKESRARIGGRFDRPLAVAVGYLALITIAELVTNLVSVSAGLLLHSVILVGLLAHATRPRAAASRRLLLTLAFAPLIRLLSLTLPREIFPAIYWYVVVSLPIIVAAFLSLRPLGFDRRAIGLAPGNLLAQAPIALTGVLLGMVEFQILGPTPLVASLSLRALLVPALILVVFTGVFEELIFRGLIQSAAIGTLGRRGILYVAILFAVMHVGWKSWWDVVFVFLVGLFFGWLVERTHSLLGVSLSHGLNNVMLFLVLPLVPISLPIAAPSAITSIATAVPRSTAVAVLATPTTTAPARATPSPAAVAAAPTPLPTLAAAPPPTLTATPLPTLRPHPTTAAAPRVTPSAGARAVVSVDWLNVREGPGQSYPIRASVPRGTGYAIVSGDGTGQWWFVCCPIGGVTPGWIWDGGVEVGGNSAAAPSDNPVAVVGATWLNVRRGPGTSYPVLVAIPLGRSYPIIGRDAARQWLEVCCPVGGQRPGWIYAEAVASSGNLSAVPIAAPGGGG
ncbi:MAG TPA: CPBP family glutamic-type intramembrane protease [Chloroflexota bacterium]|nr:CPBP family glutamic-type intramembrane protease [Chloroflexota bacterium]